MNNGSTEKNEIISLLVVAYALLYAFILASFPIYMFKDRIAYVTYAANSHEIINGYLRHGVLKFIFNEPLWLLYNTLLKHIFSPASLISFTIFISSFIFSSSFLKTSKENFALLIIASLCPQVAMKYMVHLRQGLAIALIVVGYYNRNRCFGHTFLLMSPFIHSSAFFIVPLIYLSMFSEHVKLSLGLRMILMLAACIAMTLGIEVISKGVGARQSAILIEKISLVSGLGLLFWVSISVLLLLQGQKFIKENILSLSILVLYFLNYFTNVYASRIFETGLPLVLVSCIKLTNWRKRAFILVFSTFVLLNWKKINFSFVLNHYKDNFITIEQTFL